MRAYDIVFKKRNGGKLNREEIEFFVGSFTKGDIPDYQAAAFLMAVFIRGMDAPETALLTQAMAASGETMDLSSVAGVKVDKHSTGGVGDGTSLVLAPLAAACGAVVPMISGRGLGHTGGTLDKLESIPGFRVQLSAKEFAEQLKKIGVVIAGQTENLAPADRKFYALRDVTATVDSVPLITASILSKKFAEGCAALLLDVKTGSGAFMRDKKSALVLAKTMVGIGKRSGKKMLALVSSMDEPLGKMIGNSLEVKQAIEILKGKDDPKTKSFVELTEILGGWMLVLSGVCKDWKSGRELIRRARMDGSGLKKFREMVEMQGGNPIVCDEPDSVLPRAQKTKQVLSPGRGTVCALDARSVGVASMLLGAGRQTQESRVDPSAGIVLEKKVGDAVERGESLAEFHYSDESHLDAAEKTFLSAVKVGKGRASKRSAPLIQAVIR